MAEKGCCNIDIRYDDAKDARSQIRLFVNGVQQGETTTRGEGRGWATLTVPEVEISTGDRIAVHVEADSGRPVKLDYVELAFPEDRSGYCRGGRPQPPNRAELRGAE
jgi:hypothetical protein